MGTKRFLLTQKDDTEISFPPQAWPVTLGMDSLGQALSLCLDEVTGEVLCSIHQ